MRKSRAITLSLLGFGTAGLAAGCGTETPTTPAPARGGPPPEQAPIHAPLRPADTPAATPPGPTEVEFRPDDEWFDKDGKPIAKAWTETPDGKRVPAVHPHDRLGRPWVTDESGNLVPPPAATVYSRPVIGGIVLFYASGPGRPAQLVRPPAGGLTALRNASVSRGGFGTTGTGIGSSGA